MKKDINKILKDIIETIGLPEEERNLMRAWLESAYLHGGLEAIKKFNIKHDK